jgi:hypothetical protein
MAALGLGATNPATLQLKYPSSAKKKREIIPLKKTENN